MVSKTLLFLQSFEKSCTSYLFSLLSQSNNHYITCSYYKIRQISCRTEIFRNSSLPHTYNQRMEQTRLLKMSSSVIFSVSHNYFRLFVTFTKTLRYVERLVRLFPPEVEDALVGIMFLTPYFIQDPRPSVCISYIGYPYCFQILSSPPPAFCLIYLADCDCAISYVSLLNDSFFVITELDFSSLAYIFMWFMQEVVRSVEALAQMVWVLAVHRFDNLPTYIYRGTKKTDIYTYK